MKKTIDTERGKFTVRPYHAEDEDGVRLLWNRAFHKEMPRDLWKWKYLCNPYQQQILLCVSEDGLIVAYYGGIPYRTNLEGKTVEITQLMDIMSHPDYRKTGIFIKTAHLFFDYAHHQNHSLFFYGYPGKYHLDLGEKYLGYKALLTPMVFLKIPTAELAAKKTELAGKISRIEKIGNSFDHLWKRCQKDYPLSVIRDSAFVRWRYAEHPLHTYEIWGFHLYSQKNLDGYAVFRLEEGKARLIDLLVPFSEKILSAFLSQIAGEYSKKNIEFIETWLPGSHFTAKQMCDMGFSDHPEPFGFIPTVRLFENCPSLEWVSENFYYTMGDGDLV